MLNETNEKIPQTLLNILLEHQNIMFWEMFENQKIEWVREKFKKRDLYIKEEAVFFILDMIENNKAQLSFEIEKISYLVKMSKEKVINLSNIEEYLFHSKIETPFSLYSAILKKNLNKAIDILDNLFLTNEISLLNGIIWAHRRFLNAIDLYENHNMQFIDIFNNLKIFSIRDKNDFKIGFDNYNFNHACLMFYYLSELDYYLKILPSNLQLVKLQEFIINFINGDIHKSFLQGPLQFLHS
jgi:DNA polymerase-3 subunit delta